MRLLSQEARLLKIQPQTPFSDTPVLLIFSSLPPTHWSLNMLLSLLSSISMPLHELLLLSETLQPPSCLPIKLVVILHFRLNHLILWNSFMFILHYRIHFHRTYFWDSTSNNERSWFLYIVTARIFLVYNMVRTQWYVLRVLFLLLLLN